MRNPRFSYGGGKIASELLTLHLGGHRGLETVIFRPHNFYGPDMGNEHVIPEITRRIVELSDGLRRKAIDLPIQGDGSETRSFCFVTDGSRGAYQVGELGQPGEIYHLGTEREISIRDLVQMIGRSIGVEVTIVRPGELRAGGTTRRCPDITKARALGYEPQVSASRTASPRPPAGTPTRPCATWQVRARDDRARPDAAASSPSPAATGSWRQRRVRALAAAGARPVAARLARLRPDRAGRRPADVRRGAALGGRPRRGRGRRHRRQRGQPGPVPLRERR